MKSERIRGGGGDPESAAAVAVHFLTCNTDSFATTWPWKALAMSATDSFPVSAALASSSPTPLAAIDDASSLSANRHRTDRLQHSAHPKGGSDPGPPQLQADGLVSKGTEQP